MSLHLCVAPEMLSLVAASGYVLNAPAPIASRVRAVSMDAAKMECAAAAATACLHPSCPVPALRAAPQLHLWLVQRWSLLVHTPQWVPNANSDCVSCPSR